MIKSMTGFGKGDNEADGRKFTVEIKSVNHRYNDINIKLPRFMFSLEDRIRKHIMQRISRGKTDVYINFETFSQDDVAVKLNEQLAAAVTEKLNILKDKFGLESQNTLDLVARFPDIITTENVEENEEMMYNILLPALDKALEQFIAMRQREGAALRDDILKKCKTLRSLTEKIELRSAQVPEEYRIKLRTRIDELLGEVPVDEQRISQEVLIFADRCCIDEEITRLYSHISQLEDIMDSDGPVGRKLDFLVQELNRESNTSASKSSDITVTQTAIDLKSEIEKIREQIQNIE